MKLLEIWRYPVKSMQGERLPRTTLTARGVEGDRVYAVKTANGRIASAKNAHRFGSLFECYAAGVDGAVTVRLPSGDYAIGDCEDVLSAFLGEPVYVSAEAPAETEIDYIDLDDTPLTFPPMAGAFFDTAPVHVLFTGELRRLSALLPDAVLDIRRFRPNLLVEGDPDALGAGTTLRIGKATLVFDGPCPRCIMTTLPQPAGIPRDTTVLKTIAADLSGNFGWLARVEASGPIAEGDAVA